MGRSYKKIIYVLMPFLAYYVVHDVTRLLMMFGLQLISSKSSGAYAYIRAHDAMISGVISLIDMLVGAFVLLLLMKHDEEELSIWDYVNLNGIGFYRTDRIHSAAFSWILILVQAVSMALGLNILIKLSGLMNISSYDATSGAQYSIPLWFGLFLYGLVSPAVEELLFRTVFFSRMKRRFHPAIAVIVSSMFFGLYHGNLVQGIYGFAMGLLMCIACEYVHSVTGAFLMHSAANLTIYLAGLKGLLLELNSPKFCIIFLGIGCVTILAEVIYSLQTLRLFGPREGIEAVGCFYVDPTLFEEE